MTQSEPLREVSAGISNARAKVDDIPTRLGISAHAMTSRKKVAARDTARSKLIMTPMWIAEGSVVRNLRLLVRT